MNYDDYVPEYWAKCTECHETFEDGVEEGYTICLDCGCAEIDHPTFNGCYLAANHEEPCLFVKPEDEVSEKEVAEAVASIQKAAANV